MLEDHTARNLENLRYIHWYIILVQNMELWKVLLMESPTMASQVGMGI